MTHVRFSFVAALLVSFAGSLAFAVVDEKLLSEASALRERGEFEKASQTLQTYLDQSTSTLELAERRQVEFEVERIRRIRQDYKQTREKLLETLKRRISDFTEEEFNQFEREGKFDVQVIDGQKLYVNSSASNLLLRVPELRIRQKNPKQPFTYRKLYAQMQRINEARKLTSSTLVLPQDIGVTYTLVVNPNAALEGKVVRAWLPYVHAFPFQTDSYIIATDPSQHLIAPPEYPHRSIYLERTAAKDQPTTFQVQYIYRSWARAFDINAQNVQPYDKTSCHYQFYTADRDPHLDQQNEELKRLSSEIVSGETNPYLVARKIYDWIANNTIYQFAREYSTLENIAYYCGSRKAGDCGQHAMLFIALCRMNGIPARWQSGWENFESVGNSMHDWSEIYFEPFGWVPIDVDMAVNFIHSGENQLDTTQTKVLVDFMFCNMDNYRLATNSDFSAPLYPPKTDFRSETVDFQRGEVECDGKNLYFDQWDYEMDIQLISTDEASAIAKRFQPAEVPLPPPPVVPPPTPAVKAADLTTSAPTDAATAITTATVEMTSGTTQVIVPPAPPGKPDDVTTAAQTQTVSAVTAPSAATTTSTQETSVSKTTP